MMKDDWEATGRWGGWSDILAGFLKPRRKRDFGFWILDFGLNHEIDGVREKAHAKATDAKEDKNGPRMGAKERE
jgi:hypothetical protein